MSGFETSMIVLPAEAPWEQAEGEPTLWYLRFDDYRSLPPQRRSLRAAWERSKEREEVGCGWDAGRWRSASELFRWKERGDAWDVECRNRIREEELERYEAIRKRHLAVLDLYLSKVEARLETLDPSMMSPKDVNAALRTIIGSQRLIHGKPDSIQQVSSVEITQVEICPVLPTVRVVHPEPLRISERFEEAADAGDG